MSSVASGQSAQEFSFVDRRGRQRRFPYWCYVPQDASAGGKLPLLLFLHGAGERGTDLTPVKKHGPPRLIDQGQEFPFVVVSPQCPAGQWWAQGENVQGLEKLIRHVQGQYPIDADRIYGTGMSMGGYGIWALAAQFPELLAAIVPICGGGDITTAPALRQTPIWAFHGREDDIVPPVRSEEMVEAIRRSGGDVKLTIYDQVGHHSWAPTYDNREIYRWLLSHTRRSSPPGAPGL